MCAYTLILYYVITLANWGNILCGRCPAQNTHNKQIISDPFTLWNTAMANISAHSMSNTDSFVLRIVDAVQGPCLNNETPCIYNSPYNNIVSLGGVVVLLQQHNSVKL